MTSSTEEKMENTGLVYKEDLYRIVLGWQKGLGRMWNIRKDPGAGAQFK